MAVMSEARGATLPAYCSTDRPRAYQWGAWGRQFREDVPAPVSDTDCATTSRPSCAAGVLLDENLPTHNSGNAIQQTSSPRHSDRTRYWSAGDEIRRSPSFVEPV